MAKKCALRGCNNEVPKWVAEVHKDPYCSTTCFRVAHKRMSAAQAAKERKMSEASAEAADRGQWRARGVATYAARERK